MKTIFALFLAAALHAEPAFPGGGSVEAETPPVQTRSIAFLVDEFHIWSAPKKEFE